MGNIKQSTIYILFFIIIFLVTLSINKILAITLLLVALFILIGKNIYLRKIIKANKLYAGKNYSEALKLYRQTVNRKNIPGFIVNNYLIMELKYGDCTIAQNYINSLSLNNSKIKSADLLSIKISKSLVAWKNNKSDEAINYLKELLEESETTYLYETLTSLLIVNNKLDDVQSLDSLKKALNYIDEKYQAKSISTSVVGKNDGNWYDSFVIGAGRKQGVKDDSIVINGNGLVGIVYEVSDNYSKAISLLDTKSSVSFKLLKDSNLKGVITQNSTLDDKENYKNKGYLYGYMFDSSYNVLPGDVVTTSGLGLYPEGIPIGEVDKVIDDKNKSMKFVVVKPYVNFKNIDDVTIVEPRNIG